MTPDDLERYGWMLLAFYGGLRLIWDAWGWADGVEPQPRRVPEEKRKWKGW